MISNEELFIVAMIVAFNTVQCFETKYNFVGLSVTCSD